MEAATHRSVASALSSAETDRHRHRRDRPSVPRRSDDHTDTRPGRRGQTEPMRAEHTSTYMSPLPLAIEPADSSATTATTRPRFTNAGTGAHLWRLSPTETRA